MAKELLTDVTVRTAKPSDKDKRLNDGGGLYLLIKPNGVCGGDSITPSTASVKPSR